MKDSEVEWSVGIFVWKSVLGAILTDKLQKVIDRSLSNAICLKPIWSSRLAAFDRPKSSKKFIHHRIVGFFEAHSDISLTNQHI